MVGRVLSVLACLNPRYFCWSGGVRERPARLAKPARIGVRLFGPLFCPTFVPKPHAIIGLFHEDSAMRLISQQARRILLTLAVAAALASELSAQYRFDHWTTDNGLPENSIWG